MCIDYQVFNNINVGNKIPAIDELLDEVHGAAALSISQSWISSQDTIKSRYITKIFPRRIFGPKGHCGFLAVYFGLTNAYYLMKSYE